MKNKAKLAFEMLEKEMEVLIPMDLENIIGGDGVIRSGRGTLADPFVITVEVLNYDQNTIVNAGVSSLNGGCYQVDGKYYTIEAYTSTPSAAPVIKSGKDVKGNNYNYWETSIHIASGNYANNVNAYGTATSQNTLTIYAGKINGNSYDLAPTSTGMNTWSMADVYLHTVAHEVAHSLGILDTDDVPIMNKIHTELDENQKSRVYGGPGDLDNNSIRLMLQRGKIHMMIDETGSTGDEDDSDGNTSNNTVSTGVDDIGFFIIYQSTDSSGNASTYIQHPYGVNNNHNYYSTSGYSPTDNWNSKIGILNCGEDDYGSYYNFAYTDEYNNVSTGYYHVLNIPQESTGNDSTGTGG